VERRGHPGRPFAHPLGVSPQAVYQAVARGRETCRERGGLQKQRIVLLGNPYTGLGAGHVPDGAGRTGRRRGAHGHPAARTPRLVRLMNLPPTALDPSGREE